MEAVPTPPRLSCPRLSQIWDSYCGIVSEIERVFFGDDRKTPTSMSWSRVAAVLLGSGGLLLASKALRKRRGQRRTTSENSAEAEDPVSGQLEVAPPSTADKQVSPAELANQRMIGDTTSPTPVGENEGRNRQKPNCKSRAAPTGEARRAAAGNQEPGSHRGKRVDAATRTYRETRARLPA